MGPVLLTLLPEDLITSRPTPVAFNQGLSNIDYSTHLTLSAKLSCFVKIPPPPLVSIQ